MSFCHKPSKRQKETHHPAAGGNFTSEAIAERLHKRNEMSVFSSKAERSFSEDVKKRLIAF